MRRFAATGLVAAGLFGVWIVRIFARWLMSNAHLRTAAKVRETMVLTGLALLRRGNLPGVASSAEQCSPPLRVLWLGEPFPIKFNQAGVQRTL